MPNFLLIAGGSDLDKRNPSRPMILERYTEWLRDLQARGQFLAGYKLYDQTGRRLSVRGGEVIEGPFTGSKDAVGGIFIVESDSLDEATKLARACPTFSEENGWVEVRLIEVSRQKESR